PPRASPPGGPPKPAGPPFPPPAQTNPPAPPAGGGAGAPRVGPRGGGRPRAVGVHEAECGGFVRGARCGVRGDRLSADRLAGRGEPLLPFVGADRFTGGVRQEMPAERGATRLRTQGGGRGR